MDRYGSFAALAAGEVAGEDYRIVVQERPIGVIIMAPHGGWIEPGTSELAAAIAGDTYSVYCFEGLRPGRAHGDLHITSTRFDEPVGRRLAAAAEFAVTVHGRANGADSQSVWLGGTDTGSGRRIGAQLEAAGFAYVEAAAELAGRSPKNICNATRTGRGVQLELPRALRDRLRADAAAMTVFSSAVRVALESVD